MRTTAESRPWRSLCSGALAAALVLLTALPTSVVAQAVTPLERQCYEAVQGKVAWNTSGAPDSRQWVEGNARNLCRGTTNPGATIACFQGEIQKGASWDRAIPACAGRPTAATATAPVPALPPVAPATRPSVPTAVPAAPSTDSSRACEEKDFVRESDKYFGDVCYKESATRGAGKIPTQCAAGTENHGGLCYARCRAGHTGAVTMCVPDCPPGFRNDGLHCAKGAPYGRGGGYAWQFGDPLNDNGMIKRCEADNGAGNCEKNGLIFYPKCRAGYVAMGANICSPQCPSGMVDIGVSCQKVTYDRGVGTIPNICPAGQVNDAGLCYPTCAGGQTGIGPVCWADACPANFPVKCGAMCARNQDQCAKVTTTMVTAPFKAVASIVGMVLTGGASGAVTPVVENAEREAYKQLRIQSISNMLKQRVKNERKCTLSDATALMAATGLEQLERYQSTTDIMARADPSGVSTVIDAYAKPICGR